MLVEAAEPLEIDSADSRVAGGAIEPDLLRPEHHLHVRDRGAAAHVLNGPGHQLLSAVEVAAPDEPRQHLRNPVHDALLVITHDLPAEDVRRDVLTAEHLVGHRTCAAEGEMSPDGPPFISVAICHNDRVHEEL